MLNFDQIKYNYITYGYFTTDIRACLNEFFRINLPYICGEVDCFYCNFDLRYNDNFDKKILTMIKLYNKIEDIDMKKCLLNVTDFKTFINVLYPK